MPGTAAARSIWAIALALLLIVAFALALPFIASTQIVRDGIARQLSAWSGYRVSLGAAPQIHVWPSFSADLNNVTLSPWQEGAPPAIEAEQVRVDLSALAALTGEAVFTRVRLVRPIIRVEPNGGALMFPALSSGGKLERAVEAARHLLEKDPSKPDLSSLPKGALAALEIQDGRIVRPGGAGAKDQEIMTGLAAKLDWPALARSASLSASGIWHGEAVSLEGTSTRPLLLLAGGAVQSTLSVKSAPLTLSFDGLASLADNPFVDGDLKLSSPSLKRMLDWLGTGIAPGGSIGALELACHVGGTPSRLKFERAQINIGGNPGMGAFDVALGQKPAGISGTLAFKSLDLQSLVSAFAQLPAGKDGSEDADAALDTAAPGQFDVDLRLSAASAVAGSFTLTDVAATAQVKGALAAFDVSDAKAFDGNLQFGLRVDRKGGGRAVELRIVADDIDGALASDKLDWPFLPHARGSSSIIIKGSGARWDQVFATAEGSVSANFGKGTIPGIDLDALLRKSARGGFFPLFSSGGGAQLSIDGAELKATVNGGIARIDNARVRAGTKLVSISGFVPLAGRGLALSGSLAPLGAGGTAKGPAGRTFFIGGSWSAPFVSPVITGLPPG